MWLYHRFSLSFREVEELLAERRITVSYEAAHQWCLKFGQTQVRANIHKEYGLPPTPISEEQQRGYEIGTADAFRVVAPDEVAHHSLFLKVIQRGKAVVMAATTSAQGLRIPNTRRVPLLSEEILCRAGNPLTTRLFFA